MRSLVEELCTKDVVREFFKPRLHIDGAPPMYRQCSTACNTLAELINTQLVERGIEGYICIVAEGSWTRSPSEQFQATVLKVNEVEKHDICKHNWIAVLRQTASGHQRDVDTHDKLELWYSMCLVHSHFFRMVYVSVSHIFCPRVYAGM